MDENLAKAIETITAWNPTGDVSEAEFAPLDLAYRALADAYLHSDAATREKLRKVLPSDARTLLSLSNRARRHAVATQTPDDLERALAGHCLEDFRWDPRDNFLGLKDLWDDAERFGLSPKQLFEQVAAIASDEARGYFNNFISIHSAYASSKKAKGVAKTPKQKQRK